MPAMALVTLTVTVHEPPAVMLPPLSATLGPLLAPVTTPPHVVAAPAAAVFSRLAGYVSVKATPVMAVALVLVSVKVSTDAAFGDTDVGLNAFAIVGCARTVSVEVAAAAVPALVVVTAPVELR